MIHYRVPLIQISFSFFTHQIFPKNYSHAFHYVANVSGLDFAYAKLHWIMLMLIHQFLSGQMKANVVIYECTSGSVTHCVTAAVLRLSVVTAAAT
jgi:hypothetical protein